MTGTQRPLQRRQRAREQRLRPRVVRQVAAHDGELGGHRGRLHVVRSALGSRVVCDDKILLFEEHPDAYKAIEPVIAALETHHQATRVADLTPIITVKL